MSTFSHSAGKLDRMESRLEELVQAMMVFHAEKLGVLEKFSFTVGDVQKARGHLAHLAEQLIQGLSGQPVDPEFATLIRDVSDGARPVGDWQADLDGLPALLRSGARISDAQAECLQKALSCFRQEVAESANRIRNR